MYSIYIFKRTIVWIGSSVWKHWKRRLKSTALRKSSIRIKGRSSRIPLSAVRSRKRQGARQPAHRAVLANIEMGRGLLEGLQNTALGLHLTL